MERIKYLLFFTLMVSSIVQANTNILKGIEALNNRNPAQALNFFEQAVQQGSVDGSFHLAGLYQRGIGVNVDKEKAFSLLLNASEAGHLKAQHMLGEAYGSGSGVEKDLEKAFKWFMKAAEQSFPRSQYTLGIIFESGIGRPKDTKQAMFWYQKAAEQGHIQAQTSLGYLFKIGGGIKQDYDKALYWFRKAAKQGSVTSNYNIGLMYEQGLGVPQNIETAMTFHAKSNKASSAVRLDDHRREICRNENSTKLFGVCLKWSERKDLRAAIKQAGAKVIHEQRNTWGDLYSTELVLHESSTLEIVYIKSDVFAKATYTFPSVRDLNQVVRVADFIEHKYGKADSVVGEISVGKMRYNWVLPDNIALTVSREWPETTTYLTYLNQSTHAELLLQLEAEEEIKRKNQYKRQSDAF